MKKPFKPLRFAVFCLSTTVALGLMGAGSSWVWWSKATAPTQSQPDAVLLRIPEGSSANAIGQQLQEAGLIRSQLAWKLWTRWLAFQNPAGSYQKGTYELKANEPLPNIAADIWLGRVKEDSFTIPEGWAIQDMAAYFEQKGWFSKAEFLEAVQTLPRDRFPWLPDTPLLEGFLYPDTYQIPVDQRTPYLIVDTMLKRFATLALPLYEQRQTFPELSLLDWVTFSSIVEKEAVIAAERPLIAGVFWNRLRDGMTLGSDPTVEYGLGITQTPDQPLTWAQVRTPSPYNTYINPGLPPTPIGSPGLSSLKASLAPETTDYLYFVARYDGTHVFSKTLAEHERAQGKIRDQQDALQTQANQPNPSER